MIPPRDKLLDIIVALLLGLATVGSSWCAYQASRWGGLQAYRYDRAQALRQKGTRAADLAMTQAQIDASLFVQWVAAASQGEAELAESSGAAISQGVPAGLRSVVRAGPEESAEPAAKGPLRHAPGHALRESSLHLGRA